MNIKNIMLYYCENDISIKVLIVVIKMPCPWPGGDQKLMTH